jgi:hypothetical protein
LILASTIEGFGQSPIISYICACICICICIPLIYGLCDVYRLFHPAHLLTE